MLKERLAGFCCLRSLSSFFVSSELVRNRNHAVRRRTPRIPVIADAGRNTIDEATPANENVINSTKRKYEATNNDCAIVPANEYSPDIISGIAEANKVGQDHKKIRIQQTMEEGQIGIVEHEEMMASKEENKLVDSLNNNQILSNVISEGIFFAIGPYLSFLLTKFQQTHYLSKSSGLYFMPCFIFHFLLMKYFLLLHYYGFTIYIHPQMMLLTFNILDFQALF